MSGEREITTVLSAVSQRPEVLAMEGGAAEGSFPPVSSPAREALRKNDGSGPPPPGVLGLRAALRGRVRCRRKRRELQEGPASAISSEQL